MNTQETKRTAARTCYKAHTLEPQGADGNTNQASPIVRSSTTELLRCILEVSAATSSCVGSWSLLQGASGGKQEREEGTHCVCHMRGTVKVAH